MYSKTNLLKVALYIFNFILAIFGIVLISFSIRLLRSIEDVNIDHGENLLATLVFMLGIVIAVVTVFGCVAVFMQARRMLISYAVTLVVLVIVQLVLLSIIYAATGDGLSSGLKQGFDELFDREEEHINGTLAQYEQWLHCCGKHSAQDYLLLDKIPPASCCLDLDCSNVLNLYVSGCEQKFKDYIDAKTSTFNAISWWLIGMEFVGSVVTCCLLDSIRNRRDRVRLYS